MALGHSAQNSTKKKGDKKPLPQYSFPKTEPIFYRISKKLYVFKEDNNYTIENIAKILDLSERTVRRILKANVIDFGTVLRISIMLGISLDDLIKPDT